jgi:copper chaperone
MEFTIPAMSCGHCVGAVTQAVKSLDAAAQVNVDLPSKKVVVQTSQDRQAVAAVLAEAGYPAQ